MSSKRVKIFVKRSFRLVENGNVSIVPPLTVIEVSEGTAADVVSASKAEVYNPAEHDKLVKKEKK